MPYCQKPFKAAKKHCTLLTAACGMRSDTCISSVAGLCSSYSDFTVATGPEGGCFLPEACWAPIVLLLQLHEGSTSFFLYKQGTLRATNLCEPSWEAVRIKNFCNVRPRDAGISHGKFGTSCISALGLGWPCQHMLKTWYTSSRHKSHLSAV